MLRTELDHSMHAHEGCPPVRWRVSDGLVDYEAAVAEMERQVALLPDVNPEALVWLVEHPPLYTAGTSADEKDLIDRDRFPVFATGRGGEYTYHGPGQRVASLAWNGHRHLELCHAAAGIGADLHPLDPRQHPDDLARPLDRIEAWALFFGRVLRMIPRRIGCHSSGGSARARFHCPRYMVTHSGIDSSANAAAPR